jgi:acyl dehydratase
MMQFHNYADLEVGSIWRSAARTLTETELTWSCMTSGDWHAIHADAHASASTLVAQRMFHGTYGVHVAVGLASRLPNIDGIVIAALGFEDWKFLAPLLVNDTVAAEVELVSKRLTRDGKRGVLERRIRLVAESRGTLQEGIFKTLVRLDATTS